MHPARDGVRLLLSGVEYCPVCSLLAPCNGRARHEYNGQKWAISEFPKWRKYLILLSFLDNSSARPVQIGGVDVNICHSRSTAVRGRRRSSSQSPPRGPFCRTRTGPVEADGAVDAQNAPTAPWKTLCVFHELPQGLSHQVTHEKLRKAPKYRWETRIDPRNVKLFLTGPYWGRRSPGRDAMSGNVLSTLRSKVAKGSCSRTANSTNSVS